MDFFQIQDRNSRFFAEFWDCYKSSFISDERRSFEKQLAIVRNPEYHLHAATIDNNFIGFLSSWKFDDFVFLEHFAIVETERGRGYGSDILKEFISSSKVPIILEVEKPVSTDQKRRIAFYLGFGFHLNTFDYIQPSYGDGKNPLHLLLMSYPKELDDSSFNKIRDKLHTFVYGLKTSIK